MIILQQVFTTSKNSTSLQQLGRQAAIMVIQNWCHKTYKILPKPRQIQIRHSPMGRPYFSIKNASKKIPAIFPDISIAHTGNTAIAGLCEDGKIGVDIENLKTRKLGPWLQRAFVKSELKLVNDFQNLLMLWCAKESVAKALGVGITGRWTDFKVVKIKNGGRNVLVEFKKKVYTVKVNVTGDEIVAICKISSCIPQG